MYATEKQISYLLSLASQVAGRPIRYIPELEPYCQLSKSALRKPLSKADASAMITSLQKRLGRKR